MYVIGRYQQVKNYADSVYDGNASMVADPYTLRWSDVHEYAYEGEFYCAYDPRVTTPREKVDTPYPEFEPGKSYRQGGVIQYQGGHYIVHQAHTSQADWTPDVAVSLFGIYDISDYPQWRQPFGEHDAYPIGYRVEHNGQFWECVQGDASGLNVWEPGVFGWITIEVSL